jgi:hypothetical protein
MRSGFRSGFLTGFGLLLAKPRLALQAFQRLQDDQESNSSHTQEGREFPKEISHGSPFPISKI